MNEVFIDRFSDPSPTEIDTAVSCSKYYQNLTDLDSIEDQGNL
jgi:hypothetical protein